MSAAEMCALSSSPPVAQPSLGPGLISIAIVGYDGVVHWNAHFTARRASLPIDPNIAALYADWGVVSSADELLSNYEHPIVRPSSLATGGGDPKTCQVGKRVLPLLGEPFGTPMTRRLHVGGKLVEVHVVDVHGCMLLVFARAAEATAGGGSAAADDPFDRPRVSGSHTTRQLACRMGAIVRVTCRPPPGEESSLVVSILDPLSCPPTTSAWRESGEEKLRSTPAYWEGEVSLVTLHQKIVSIGSALVQCAYTEAL